MSKSSDFCIHSTMRSRFRRRTQVAFQDDSGESLCIVKGKPVGSLTKQSFKDYCDINKIIPAMARPGVSANVSNDPPLFGDFSAIPDYKQSLERVIECENRFASLPAKIRDRFKNDPQSFETFMSDEANKKEMIELGLIKEDVPTPPTPPTPPVPPAPEPAPKPPVVPPKG